MGCQNSKSGNAQNRANQQQNSGQISINKSEQKYQEKNSEKQIGQNHYNNQPVFSHISTNHQFQQNESDQNYQINEPIPDERTSNKENDEPQKAAELYPYQGFSDVLEQQKWQNYPNGEEEEQEKQLNKNKKQSLIMNTREFANKLKMPRTQLELYLVKEQKNTGKPYEELLLELQKEYIQDPAMEKLQAFQKDLQIEALKHQPAKRERMEQQTVKKSRKKSVTEQRRKSTALDIVQQNPAYLNVLVNEMLQENERKQQKRNSIMDPQSNDQSKQRRKSVQQVVDKFKKKRNSVQVDYLSLRPSFMQILEEKSPAHIKKKKQQQQLLSVQDNNNNNRQKDRRKSTQNLKNYTTDYQIKKKLV